jgi:hypothetical protein
MALAIGDIAADFVAPRSFVLVVVALIFLSQPSHPSAARTPLAPQGAPGQVTEVIAPAAVIVATAHYQALLALNCSGLACTGDFPPPGRKRRLRVTRMSCWLLSSSAATTFRYGYIALLNADGSSVLNQFLPADYSADSYVTLNRAVDMHVAAQQRIQTVLFVAGGFAGDAICTATGTQETLQ